MKQKKWLAMTLASSMMLSSLVACSSGEEVSETNTNVSTQNTTTGGDTTPVTASFSSPIVTTGQSNTYDQDGNIISVSQGEALYGQDGNYNSLAFSFTVNEDGTTTDHNTGLMWETIPMGGKMSWEEAIAYCNELELGGYSDWRIPTVEELFSISDFSQGWPYLDTDYFQFDDSGDSLMMAGGMGDGSPQGNSGGPQGTSAITTEQGNVMISLNTPQGSAPQGEMPQGEMPQGEMPQGEMPQGEMPQGEMPQGEMPQGEMPQGEMPQGEMPQGEMPQGEMPQGEMPQGEMPQGEMPQGEMPPMGEGMMPDGEMPEMAGVGPMEGESGGASKDDGQFWTVSHNMVEGDDRLGDIAFGVNHSTGHIKAYPAESTPMMGKYVRAVRGDVYGTEDYTDNGDGTITDNASGLMWMQDDLAVAVDWAEALALGESYEFAGYDDWRLPDVKELQSIVDYGGAYPAINQDYFHWTDLEMNENYYYWTSTSAYFSEMAPDYDSAWYVAFGYTSHGAGAVRFSPKYEGSNALSEGEDNIMNSVRLVRDV